VKIKYTGDATELHEPQTNSNIQDEEYQSTERSTIQAHSITVILL